MKSIIGIIISIIIVISLFYLFYELGHSAGVIEGVDWMRDKCIAVIGDTVDFMISELMG